MSDLDATLAALRAALAVSPDNLPLRLHLARTLRAAGRASDADDLLRPALTQLKAAIAASPADPALYEQQADLQQALGEEAAALLSLGIATALRGAPAGATGPTTQLRPATPAEPSEPLPPPPDDLPRQQLVTEDAPHDPFDELAERPTVNFADVGGMEEVKEQVRMAIVYPFQRPELFAQFGRKAGGGVLLYGPPGCGKTFLARATAGEVGANFITVGIADVLDMYVGNSEKKIQALFAAARRSRPCVLFFDELEAIGGNRMDMRQHHQRTLVNQFLAELDGAEGDNTEVLIIGATNSPWHVDSALRRPGRFDSVVFVAPPDEPARAAILALHLRGRPVAEVDVARLARETDGFSGADLKALVDAASDAALRAALRGGAVTALDTAALLRALKSVRPTTSEWLATAKNYVLFSNEGGVYDEVAAYLRKRKLLR